MHRMRVVDCEVTLSLIGRNCDTLLYLHEYNVVTKDSFVGNLVDLQEFHRLNKMGLYKNMTQVIDSE